MRHLTRESLYKELAAMTGLSADAMLRQMHLLQFLPDVERQLKEAVVGQDAAVEAVIASLRSRALRGVENRPQLALLCVGPTGVGKTELALQLARVVAGGDARLLRVDGSEYREEHTVARLIGAPPGYKGYDESGLLTEGVRRMRRGVLLVDELEKANRSVHNLFLQVLSAGHLTDATGLRVDFRHMLVIMTTNAGSQELPAAMDAALRSAFSPELLGRFDRTVAFNPLTTEHLGAILDRQVSRLATAVPGLRSIRLEPAARASLVDEAQHAQAGARGIDQVIRQRVERGLSELQLRGGLEGAEVSIGWDEQGFTFRRL